MAKNHPKTNEWLLSQYDNHFTPVNLVIKLLQIRCARGDELHVPKLLSEVRKNPNLIQQEIEAHQRRLQEKAEKTAARNAK